MEYELKSNLPKLARALGLATETIVRRVAVDLHGRITLRTPVDTGRARAGWGLGEVPSVPGIQPITGHQPVYITNNVPYIVYLEQGSSQQAPIGMVRVSLAEIEAEHDAIIRDGIRAAEDVMA